MHVHHVATRTQVPRCPPTMGCLGHPGADAKFRVHASVHLGAGHVDASLPPQATGVRGRPSAGGQACMAPHCWFAEVRERYEVGAWGGWQVVQEGFPEAVAAEEA